MSQYIITKYLPCTNTKPARIKAKQSYGPRSVIASIDRLTPGGIEDAHHEAAKLLLNELEANARGGWAGKWIAGGGPDGNVYVPCPALLDGQGFIVEPWQA